MAFTQGSKGIYSPIRVLFETPIYEFALQTCWHTPSYKSKIALVTELLMLQQRNLLSSEVTLDAMTNLLVLESKKTLRAQLWDFGLQDFDEDEARPLLKLVWLVNTSLLIRDVEFEARRLLDSPEAIPPTFKHPKIISQAREYAKILVEQQREAPVPKLLGPQEVVLDIMPKVIQGFWKPKKNTSRYMPSQQLSKIAVGVTKAVLDRVSTALFTTSHQIDFSPAMRDERVLSIDEKVRQMHPPDIIRKKLNCFEADVLNIITDVAVENICVLFAPQTHLDLPTDQPPAITAIQEDKPAEPAESAPKPEVTLPAEETSKASVLGCEVLIMKPSRELLDESPAIIAVPEDLTISMQAPPAEPAKQSAAPNSAAIFSPPASVTSALCPAYVGLHQPAENCMSCLGPDSAEEPVALNTIVTLPSEDSVFASVLGGQLRNEEPTKEPDHAVVAASTAPVTLPAEDASKASTLENEVTTKEFNLQPRPALLPALTSSVTDEVSLHASVLGGEVIITKELSLEPDSAEVPAESTPITPPVDKALLLEGQGMPEKLSQEQGCGVVPAPKPEVTLPAEETSKASVLGCEVLIMKPSRELLDESPAIIAVPEDLSISMQAPPAEPAKQSAAPNSAAIFSPPASVTSALCPAYVGLHQPAENCMSCLGPDSAEEPAALNTIVTLPSEDSVFASVLGAQLRNEEPTKEPDHAVVPASTAPVTLPAEDASKASTLEDEVTTKEFNLQPRPALLPALTSSVTDEVSLHASVLGGEVIITEELSLEPESAEVPAVSTPITPPADKALLLEGQGMPEKLSQEQGCAVVPAPTPSVALLPEASLIASVIVVDVMPEEPSVEAALQTSGDAALHEPNRKDGKVKRRIRHVIHWLRKNIFCCVQFEDDY